MVRVEAAQRDHAALEPHPLDEALGLALLLTIELTVVVLIEALQDHLTAVALAALRALGGGRRRDASDEREGEKDSFHALPTRHRAER